jgi:hypothetical protein
MEGNMTNLGLNPIFYPKYWIGLTTTSWPNFLWTDGKTPGPDVFNSASTLYRHWGSYMWAAALLSWAPDQAYPCGSKPGLSCRGGGVWAAASPCLVQP